MKEGFVFAAGGSEPFIREVGWGEEHFRQGLVIFHKSIHFLSVICPKTACNQNKSFFWFVRSFFWSLCSTLVVRRTRFDKVMETGALRGKECVI